MPSETPQSQAHRPSLAGHRSTSSIHSQQTDSPSSTPPQHGKAAGSKHAKHVVGGGHHHHHAPRMHARVPSSKSMHAVAASKRGGGSTDNLKKLGRNASATNVRKNSSHVSLKRNQSSGDVSRNKALKLAAEERREEEGRRREGAAAAAGGVHFEIGDQVEGDEEDEDEDGEENDGDGDGWEEASSSASPAISRSASRPNSAKQSADNSQPQSPQHTTFKVLPTATSMTTNPTILGGGDGTMDKEKDKDPRPQPHLTADAKIITERLLQRVPSHNTTKMSLATATPSQAKPTPRSHQPDTETTTRPNSNGTSQYGSKEEVISRFVSGSGTPHEPDFLSTRTSSSTSPSKADDIKRAQSMGNLTRRDSSRLNSEREDLDNDESDRPLAPKTRSRKSSTGNAYTPPHTSSRTQQKLMLQRASSNIDPQNLAHPPLSLGMGALGLGYAGGGVTGLVGSGIGYDGRDPRIKAQLDRTGLEYLVVRRHQDPIGVAIKRLNKLPGAAKNKRIPTSSGSAGGKGKADTTRKAGLGLSQSLKDVRKGASTNSNINNSNAADSTGGAKVGSYGSERERNYGGAGRADDNEDSSGGGGGGVNAILRSLWEKNFDFSSSAD